jgi:predicted amidohydrolase YtcJ
MNDAAMRAEAIAEQDGRIIAVGSSDEVMQLRGPDTRLIDLNGRALLPGFVDAHGHVMMGGLQALSANLLARRTVTSRTSPRCNRCCVTGLPPTRRRWT